MTNIEIPADGRSIKRTPQTEFIYQGFAGLSDVKHELLRKDNNMKEYHIQLKHMTEECKKLRQEIKDLRCEKLYLKEQCVKAGKELEKYSFTWDGKEKNLSVQAYKLNELYEAKVAECERLKSELELETGISYKNQSKLQIATEALKRIRNNELADFCMTEAEYKVNKYDTEFSVALDLSEEALERIENDRANNN